MQNKRVPFTPSHIAAVLPFLRTPLPGAALVVGSMVPDLPYFVPLGISRQLTHSVPGVLIADLPMALAVLALWTLVFQAPLRDFSPGWLRRRLPVPRRMRSTRALPTLGWAVLAVLVGVITHLIWDSFTHPDGWIVLAVPAFHTMLGHFTVYRWAQYASSVVGLVIIVAWLALWVRRSPMRREDETGSRLSKRARCLAWLAVAIPGLSVGIAVWGFGLVNGIDAFDRVLVYRTATLSISCAGLVAVVIALSWYLSPLQTPPLGTAQD